MKQNKLGKSDIAVSQLCLGTMTWGEQNNEQEAQQQLDYAIERGINFIDTAEMYPVPPRAHTQGTTERWIGNWMQQRGNRNDIVLATKVSGGADWLPWIRDGKPRHNREHITQAIEASLERLQTDYVDLYQLHWPDRNTNYFGLLGYEHSEEEEAADLHEVLTVLQELQDQGKIRQIGVSNETPWGLMSFLALADKYQLPRVATIQNPYNLLNRTFEIGLAECSLREDVGLLAYSPLAFGALTGKYLNGQRPEGARLTMYKRFARYTSELADTAIGQYAALAQEWGMSPASLALAYVNQQPFLSSNIIGATSMKQLQENIDALSIKLNTEQLNAINKIHLNCPNPCP